MRALLLFATRVEGWSSLKFGLLSDTFVHVRGSGHYASGGLLRAAVGKIRFEPVMSE